VSAVWLALTELIPARFDFGLRQADINSLLCTVASCAPDYCATGLSPRWMPPPPRQSQHSEVLEQALVSTGHQRGIAVIGAPANSIVCRRLDIWSRDPLAGIETLCPIEAAMTSAIGGYQPQLKQPDQELLEYPWDQREILRWMLENPGHPYHRFPPSDG